MVNQILPHFLLQWENMVNIQHGKQSNSVKYTLTLLLHRNQYQEVGLSPWLSLKEIRPPSYATTMEKLLCNAANLNRLKCNRLLTNVISKLTLPLSRCPWCQGSGIYFWKVLSLFSTEDNSYAEWRKMDQDWAQFWGKPKTPSWLWSAFPDLSGLVPVIWLLQVQIDLVDWQWLTPGWGNRWVQPKGPYCWQCVCFAG